MIGLALERDIEESRFKIQAIRSSSVFSEGYKDSQLRLLTAYIANAEKELEAFKRTVSQQQ